MEEIILLSPEDFPLSMEGMERVIMMGTSAPCNCQCSAPRGHYE